MMKDDCIFCKIVRGEIPSKLIYENTELLVIMDASPANRGHLLIIPREHFDDVYDIDAVTAGKVFQMASVVARSLKEVLHCDGINILQNNGQIAGQTVFHFHMHVIPRFKGDKVNIGWEEQSFDDQEMEDLRMEIRKAL